jgi:ATP-dependent HslUV protease ATP-binding subunit HslU
MVYYMPGKVRDAKMINGEELTPRQIVDELDKYIIGQDKAKKAVAIALRNRIRRQKLPPEMAEEVAPKNIIMMGPTGIGKTEIARRLAKLARSPFLKVEASKFTEVGYVGRDVDSMIRDLTEIAVKLVKEEEVARVEHKAKEIVEDRILDILFPHQPRERQGVDPADVELEHRQRTREKLKEQLREGKLDDREIPVEVQAKAFPHVNILSQSGMEEIDFTNIKDMLPGFFPSQTKKKKMKLSEAAEILIREEEQKLIDMDRVSKDAIERLE